jgi:GTP pyrophosphokinase
MELPESKADDALEFATQKHKGVYRRGGAEYITHPTAVADTVARVKPGSHQLNDLKAAAYLHDTVEDTDTTYAEILEVFGPTVMTLVHELTSDEEQLKALGKTEYLKRKFAGISSWGLVIKLADRLSNVGDLDEAEEGWAIKYATQTKAILDYLKQNRKLSPTHKQLVDEIESIINGYLTRHGGAR